MVGQTDENGLAVAEGGGRRDLSGPGEVERQ